MQKRECIALPALPTGAAATVETVGGTGPVRRRLLDLGLLPGAAVEAVHAAPWGDPRAYRVQGALLALRRRDAACVRVRPARPAGGGALIALAGNPNVGKSTLFNSLTGLRQHTGNWPGKTVALARGRCRGRDYELIDLPGTYSLFSRSPEEEIARDCLRSGEAAATVVVCDATCLVRSLSLALQVMELGGRVLVAVNLLDEAAHKGLSLDLPLLQRRLGVPVLGLVAHRRRSREKLLSALDALLAAPPPAAPCRVRYPEGAALRLPGAPVCAAADRGEELCAAALLRTAEALCEGVVRSRDGAGPDERLDRRLDRLLTGRVSSWLLIGLMLAGVFYLSIRGANLPSAWLGRLLLALEAPLGRLLAALGAPPWLRGLLTEGAWRVLAWVVSVMLPPMAIFFPLFTLLEDAGVLPRLAYDLDRPFQHCRACGKQALCMMMGLGCNAAGVTGCRIIESERERLLAILTNSLVPCNGRFPTLIALSALFWAGGGSGLLPALGLTGLLCLSLLMSLAATGLLAHTLLKGESAPFVLELPPYRLPRVGRVLVRSLLDRTLFVLGRAAAVAAPAGALLWALGHIPWGGRSLLEQLAALLEAPGRFLGMDGVLLLAFVLGLPANEIVLPIALMLYSSGSVLTEPGSLAELGALLTAQGWTARTAGAVMLFCLFHWPCSTTLLTVKKETGRWRWALLAAALPTALGVILCALLAAL